MPSFGMVRAAGREATGPTAPTAPATPAGRRRHPAVAIPLPDVSPVQAMVTRLAGAIDTKSNNS